MGADSAPLVVSTHSTVFLDHKNPERTQTYLVRRVESAASLSKGRRPRRRGPSARRHSLSDVASAERVLLVEGDSDVAVLNAWFGSKLVRHGIAVVPMDGGDKASHTETVIRVLQQADTLDRRVVFLRERDELSDESAAKLDASGNVHLLARRELENYLLEPDAVAQVLNLGQLDASASNGGALASSSFRAPRQRTWCSQPLSSHRGSGTLKLPRCRADMRHVRSRRPTPTRSRTGP